MHFGPKIVMGPSEIIYRWSYRDPTILAWWLPKLGFRMGNSLMLVFHQHSALKLDYYDFEEETEQMQKTDRDNRK